MRYFKYCLVIPIFVIIFLNAESFIVQKSAKQKKARIKKEDTVVQNESIIRGAANLHETLAQVTKSCLCDVREAVELPKNSFFATASQQDLQYYNDCEQKIEAAIQECTKVILDEHQKLKTRCFFRPLK